MNARVNPDDPIERPSWLVPLILFGLTAVIGGVILFFFLAPDLEEMVGLSASPTEASDRVALTIAEQAFSIPSNYIRLDAARGGGALNEVALDAILPDLHGYAADDADTLKDVSSGSPVLSLTLRAGAPALDERQRFDRIYAKNADSAAKPATYQGFTVTAMSAASGYAGQNVLTRDKDGQFIVLLCTPDDQELDIGGLCQRELAWRNGLTLIYALRSGRLAQFDRIDTAVQALVASFALAEQRKDQ